MAMVTAQVGPVVRGRGGLCGVPAVREGGNSRKRGLKGMNLEAGGGKGTPLFEKGRELLNRNFIIHVSLLQA